MQTTRKAPRLAIVLPCFNEAPSLEHGVPQLLVFLRDLVARAVVAADSYLLFIDDGSADQTWAVIERFSKVSTDVHGLKLSRNYGHQIALLSGLDRVAENCDAAVSIDADLQQDLAAIELFVNEYRQGFDIVYGVRRSRATDGIFKKISARGFYLISKWMGVRTVAGHADFRLMSRAALEALSEFEEPNLYLRAMVMELGFKTTVVEFDVSSRLHGKSKYSLKKMLRLAHHGITSFSVKPLRIVSVIGFAIFCASLCMGAYVLWRKIVDGNTAPGWASITLAIYFLGGVQLLCLGVVGEYIGQIYKAVKRRPRWIVEREARGFHSESR